MYKKKKIRKKAFQTIYQKQLINMEIFTLFFKFTKNN